MKTGELREVRRYLSDCDIIKIKTDNGFDLSDEVYIL